MSNRPPFCPFFIVPCLEVLGYHSEYIQIKSIQIKIYEPGQGGQLVGGLSYTLKHHGFNFQSRHRPRLWVPVGAHTRGNQ